MFTGDDVALIGDFSQHEETAFYAEKEMLYIYQDSYKDKINIEKPRKRPLKNPILPDGRVKLGRPRKKPVDQAATAENTATGAINTSSPAKKRRTDSMPPPPANKNEGLSYQLCSSYNDFDKDRCTTNSKARATEGEANVVNSCPKSEKTCQIRV